MDKIKFLLDKIMMKVYCWTLPRMRSTSLSDDQAYPQICLDAANKYKYFNRFRRNPIYASIVETVTGDIGQKYYDYLAGDKKIADNMDEFKKNDDWGGPIKIAYPNIGEISPTTLRYAKVGYDLKKYFPNLENMRICEIGVGYGGQCRIIDVLFKPSYYCLVDIQPALLLAQRYLGNYLMKAILAFKTMNEIDEDSYDLCVSNYAFSELPRPIQDEYLRKVILRSRAGYITYSDNFTPAEFNSYRVEELEKLIPGVTVIEEEPKTGPNYIIIWGNK